MSLFRRRRTTREMLEVERARSRRALDAVLAERQRLRTALDALSVGVVLADQHGLLQVRNSAAAGFEGHEGVLVTEALEAQLRSAADGVASTRTVEFFGPPRRVLVVQASPLEAGGALATITDVSDRARVDAVRTDFVANISHELKTPIGAIAVLAEALADNDDLAVTRRLAGRMVDEAHRVSRTVDDLLELSRIELGGEAVHEHVDVQHVLHDAVQRTEMIAAQRLVTVDLDQPPADVKAIGDGRQLVSALVNLIDNAVKYSDEGSTVTLSAVASGAWVDFVVSDHGAGIPARDLDRIFERFYRVDRARSRDTGGTGLGLAIVRHVATNHGGEVLVRSEEGRGSAFTLRIPAAEPLVAAPPDDPPSES